MVQRHEDKIWYLIAYYSRKLTLIELNYNIYNKKLLAIIVALKEWRAFLQRTVELFIIKINHKNLIGFLTTKELNRRQVRQVEILAKYYFEIKYIKGIDNARANTLSRKAELQNSKKLLDAILRRDKNSKIKYNYLKLVVVYKVLKLYQMQKI